MSGTNSAVTGKFRDPPVIMTGITSRFISRPAYYIYRINLYVITLMVHCYYRKKAKHQEKTWSILFSPLDNLHVRLNFNLSKEKGIKHHNWKEHNEISIIAKFGCEML